VRKVVPETDPDFLFERARRCVWWSRRFGLPAHPEMLDLIVIDGGKQDRVPDERTAA
jgi:hypothetical protein